MSKLVLQPTEYSQWYAIVNEAECSAKLELNPEIERYLVDILIHYCGRTDILNNSLTIEYFKALHLPLRFQYYALREIAEVCLIYNGFYNEYLEKKGGNRRSYELLGKQCYCTLFERFRTELYKDVAKHYYDVCQILQFMHKLQKNSTIFL